eukprot:CAMPEP_0204300594 /NCGR_PEP_ID=MMETSP0468-20130131/78896_1 /ASSEMBLY_ACC=CAM_ASM_000383 /TAXON_ID=2969 /ORGANISM="Oxyrrhis marina" /LENGTH=32 /DNA_ID= /DNA_START= /DNA_END= /DNA_ORIENTATION=
MPLSGLELTLLLGRDGGGSYNPGSRPGMSTPL